MYGEFSHSLADHLLYSRAPYIAKARCSLPLQIVVTFLLVLMFTLNVVFIVDLSVNHQALQGNLIVYLLMPCFIIVNRPMHDILCAI